MNPRKKVIKKIKQLSLLVECLVVEITSNLEISDVEIEKRLADVVYLLDEARFLVERN